MNVNLLNCVERKYGETNLYPTQMLSGQGFLQKYLYKMGQTSRPMCIYDDNTLDDAEHTIFECERWEGEWYALEQKVGNTYIIRKYYQYNVAY